MVPFALIEIFSQIQIPETRQAGIDTLAAYTGATKVHLFGKDAEISIFLPAQGLPQTLPYGSKWQAFLRECAKTQFYIGSLPVPPDGTLCQVFGVVDKDGSAILVFLGKEPDAEMRSQISALLPLLGAKLTVERAAQSAAGHAAAAQNANRHAGALNVALDSNRRELQKAFERAEQELATRREAEKKLMEADRRKDEFLAMLAHELRNPLAPISTAAHILKIAGSDEKRVRQSSDIITRQVNHMTNLIDDLLDVSRVTRGQIELERENIDIKTVVSSAVEQARPLIESRGHALNMHMASSHAVVHGDRTRLVQVIANLLNNASKYTPRGGEIKLSVEVEKAQVQISVRDNGIGIEPELLPHVFELFTQAERTPDRSQGGLGLGLALVKSIMVLHSGSAHAHSEGRGTGSTFTIALPQAITAMGSYSNDVKEYDGSYGIHSLRVMMVDDNVDAAESLALLLEAQGHEVRIEHDPHIALECALEYEAEVFILDIGLPGMNGCDLARALKLHPRFAQAVFIALTGYGQAQDKILSKSAGFDHHFVKPIDVVELDKILAKIPSRRSHSQ